MGAGLIYWLSSDSPKRSVQRLATMLTILAFAFAKLFSAMGAFVIEEMWDQSRKRNNGSGNQKRYIIERAQHDENTCQYKDVS